MLNSKLLFDYYAFVVSYWQKKFNASQYNIEVAFYQYALTTALAQQEKDNTELNKSLVDLETEAQNNYLYVCKQRRAGLVTDAAVETALNTWKDAKFGRRSAVPNPSLLITLLRDKAQSNFNLFDSMRRKIYDPDKPRMTAADKQKWWDELPQYAKDEYNKIVEWMTITQNLRDSVNAFESQIQLFLETSEQSIDSIEDTQEAPITYQDIINESMYTFDGSYSDAANHIAPTGQVTGQLQVILKVSSRIYWTGLAWLQMPDEIDQCANTSLLPADAGIGTIFRTPPATSTNSEWSYHYKTSEGWIPMVRLWDIDGWGNRPAHGTMIGEYHILIERNVPTIWTGYEKIRIPHSVLYDDVYGMHMPPGFITTFTDLQSSHNELAEDYLGNKGDVEEALSNVNKDIGEMNGAFNDLKGSLEDMLSDGFITYIEANLLKTLLSSLLAESEDVMAESLSLAIVAERASYHTAINNLIDAFSVWLDPIDLSRDDLYWTEDILLSDTHIDENEYPIEIDPSVRTNIKSSMAQLEAAKSVLIHAITAKRSEVSAQVAADEVSFDLSQFRQVYDGFVRGFTPEFELIYVSENELSLRPRYNDYEYLTINEQNIEASKRTSVFTFTPVLNWNNGDRSLYYSMLQPSTEYWVYMANRSVGFNLNVYDFRGRLFCSDTAPTNNYLGTAGLGLNAILIGKAQVNSLGKFLYELDVSLVSRQSDLKETFREFSDFDLRYFDQDTLRLERIYGTYGQIYIPESLYYIGENREVTTTSPRILYDEDLGTISYDDSTIAAGTLYYVYIASNSDLYNFNDLNPATGLPWHPEDEGSTGIYDADKDFRLWMFLSTKTPEEGRLSESYHGFWARHIGQVRTDGKRKFSYAASISSIRQATLSPEYFDGLAEISFEHVDQSTFKVVRRSGSSGILMVNGAGIQTYNANEQDVHTVTTTDAVYAYDEAEPVNFLTDTGDDLNKYIMQPVYLYMANNRSDLWGALAGRTFLCLTAPSGGYLSGNHPGSSARYVATLKPSAGNTGLELVTSGDFASSAGWNINDGWTISTQNENCAHTPGHTDTLSYGAMSPEADQVYKINLLVNSVSSGSLTPQLGDVNGIPINSAGRHTQYIRTTGTTNLRFYPSSDSDHVIEEISCKLVQEAFFSGTYITDSAIGNQNILDDQVISSTQGWSSLQITQYVTSVVTSVNALMALDRQKVSGLSVKLVYVNSNTIRLVAQISATFICCGSDESTINIDTNGITATVSGSPDTLYHVWLSSTGLSIDTNYPTNNYTRLQTYGSSKVLVGYVAFTSSGNMGGEWNVLSLYNQPTQSWSAPITGVYDIPLGLEGVVSTRRTASISRSGVTTATFAGRSSAWAPSATLYVTGSVATGYGIFDGSWGLRGSIDVTSSHGFGTYAGDIIDSPYLRQVISTNVCSLDICYVVSSSATGDYILTRQGIY